MERLSVVRRREGGAERGRQEAMVGTLVTVGPNRRGLEPEWAAAPARSKEVGVRIAVGRAM